MKKLVLVFAMLFIGFFAQAQMTINNTSSCTFSLIALYPGGGGITYPVAPSGTTIIPGTFEGVEVASSPNSLGQPDGGIFIDPYYLYFYPFSTFPPSGSFLVVGCGTVNVSVIYMGGPITVNIN